MKNVLVIAMTLIALCFVSVRPAEARPIPLRRAGRAVGHFLAVPGFPAIRAAGRGVVRLVRGC